VRILLTNDDGIESPGLRALYEAVTAVEGVTALVVAPDRNWSISGHNKTMDRPLRVNDIKWHNDLPVLTTDGTPADCISLAGLGIIEVQPDIVMSGINLGPNLGDDVTYSGTVAAAMEAHIAGIPSVAFSVDAYLDFNFDAAATFARQLTLQLKKGLEGDPSGIVPTAELLLNVNVPNCSAAEIQGVEVTRLGRRIYKDELFRREDPRGRPYYWIGGERPGGEPVEGTDIAAVGNGRISVTPLMLDLTHYRMVDKLREYKF
jgi:5'-nucleotidase